MSLWSRVANVFRGERLNREIAEEFESHVEEAVAAGRDEREAWRALGNPPQLRRRRQAGHDARVLPWLDSLRADVIFGWRQLKRNRVTSLAAIFSLALAMGACVSAFRLLDALLWRPLPVAHAERLYDVWRETRNLDGTPFVYDSWAYPSFALMRDAVKDQAELIAVSYSERVDLTYGSDEEMEKAYVQYVSGAMFDVFGLRPRLGRLLNQSDDAKPGASPYAVLSYDYWTRRFGQDPKVIGRTLRMGSALYEIVGVAEKPFTGTEPGTVTGIFLPTMMNQWATHSDAEWHRMLVLMKPGTALEPLRQKLTAMSRAFEVERLKGEHSQPMPEGFADVLTHEDLEMKPAAAGASYLQDQYREALGVLGVLVAMVLLIACANVANLMTAQAAARAREMALRVSIGAGRLRLVRMVLVEGAMLAVLAAAMGVLLAWWSAPFVVSMINPPDNPAHLVLPADWRVLGFGLGLIFVVTLLFGLLPALRASAVKPVSVLKGGENPRGRRSLMYGMIAAQVAFCFVVVFVSGLFVATFRRLSERPLGFTVENLLLLETVAQDGKPPVVWSQVADSLRGVPGVKKVAIARDPLLGGISWNNFIAIGGAPPSTILTHFLAVSPGWIDTMRIPFVKGRDFRDTDTAPGAAIVNETFVSTYFHGLDVIGRSFVRRPGEKPYAIVGVVRDAPYRSLKERTLPVAFVPFQEIDGQGVIRPQSDETFVVRTDGGNSLALAVILREKIAQEHRGLRVSNVQTQMELVRDQTLRERLLAMLAVFFAGVALLLAGIGLYGVLSYSVLQRKREIGIRIALGARIANIAQLVTWEVFAVVIVGAGVGVALGVAAARYVQTLLYGVRGNDPAALAVPALVLLAAALLSALPAVIRAARIDPAAMLRAE